MGQISYHFDDSRTLQMLDARWSTFSDRFHNVSFTMQSHDHYWSLPLNSFDTYLDRDHLRLFAIDTIKSTFMYHITSLQTISFQYFDYFIIIYRSSFSNTVKPALVTTCLQRPLDYKGHILCFPWKWFLIESCTKGTCLQRPLFDVSLWRSL